MSNSLKIPDRSEWESCFATFLHDSGKRPVNTKVTHPFARASLIPGPLAGFSGQGGFALVFRLRDQTGREWAVRCPIRMPSHFHRDHATGLSKWSPPGALVPHLVLPKLIPEALFVGGAWQDVTVMPWVDGGTLEDIVNGPNPADWDSLATQVESLVTALAESGVAHGDLQPKNIIRSANNTLILVDYDSFLIPGGATGISPVGGLRGFGHPHFTKRSADRHFDPNMDTFAGLVLLLSLRALAKNPSLLRRESEDGFVISADELESPGITFGTLERMAEPVASLASALRRLCEDQSGGLAPWSSVIHRSYYPRYVLRLPTLPPPPSKLAYSPLVL